MSYSFPLTPPSSPPPTSVAWRENNTVAVSTSPFTGVQQVLEWDAELWAIDVTLPVMNREEAAPWIAFLSKLRAQRGTFYFGDTETATPLGSLGGTPLVNGANQTGRELVTDGWSNSTLVLKAGDRIQVGTALYRVLADATTNGSGEVTLDVWPSLQGQHANNAPIVTASAKGLFRLTDSFIEENIGVSRLWAIGFSAVEAR